MPGWPSQGIPVSWAQSLVLHFTPWPRSTPLPYQSCHGAQGPAQPSVDTLSCQALASGQAQTPRTHEFVSQLHDTMGLCPLDKTPTSCLPAA